VKTFILKFVRRFLREEEAATTVEYAVVLMLIIGTCLTAIQVVGNGGAGFWDDNQSDLNTALENARQIGQGN